MRMGLIGFPTNSGLGTLTLEFFRHLPFEKVLLIDQGKYKVFPERFPGARMVKHYPKNSDSEWLLDGIDLLLMFETPKEWGIIPRARKRGIKTVLIPMYECSPSPLPCWPDTILCPSLLDKDIFKKEAPRGTDITYLPVPVNTEIIKGGQKERAQTFRFNAGHGGMIGRSGLTDLLAAIPMTKTDARFVIYSQIPIHFEHPRVTFRIGNFENYEDVWKESSDVFIFPHKFDGLSLPIQEALAAGMPVLSTAIYPYTVMLPKEWLFDFDEMIKLKIYDRLIDVAILNPAKIAAKIDEWYGKDIRRDSRKAREMAMEISWENMKPKYLQLLTSLCKK